MPSLTAENLARYKHRINRLQPESKPRWGRMDSITLVCHLRRALQISIGEVESPDRSLPGLRKVILVLLFHVYTIWPPSRLRLPDYWLPPPEHSFLVEKDLLLKALDRFVETLEEEPDRMAVHTLLGPLMLRTWSHVHGVHFNHHFRQFRLVHPWEAPEYWRWILIPILAVIVWFLLK